jgi:lysophospholipase L1-like esterase
MAIPDPLESSPLLKASLRQAYPQLILFGDSITQQSDLSFAGPLQQRYARKADVINRGFNGYTSELALDILPKFYPSSQQADVRVMMVFFGANDACLPGSAQHVPIDEYAACIKRIVQHDLVRRQGTKVVLIIPAPVDEYQLSNDQRTAANTKLYADVCRRIGQELRLPMVDLWSLFMKQAGWDGRSELAGSRKCERSEVLGELLSDGLHFTAKAYSILLQGLTNVMYEELPEQTPERMPSVFPAWSDLLGQ